HPVKASASPIPAIATRIRFVVMPRTKATRVPPGMAARAYVLLHILRPLTGHIGSGVRARPGIFLWRASPEYGGVTILALPLNLLLTHPGTRLTQAPSTSVSQYFQYVESRHGGCVVGET